MWQNNSLLEQCFGTSYTKDKQEVIWPLVYTDIKSHCGYVSLPLYLSLATHDNATYHMLCTHTHTHTHTHTGVALRWTVGWHPYTRRCMTKVSNSLSSSSTATTSSGRRVCSEWWNYQSHQTTMGCQTVVYSLSGGWGWSVLSCDSGWGWSVLSRDSGWDLYICNRMWFTCHLPPSLTPPPHTHTHTLRDTNHFNQSDIIFTFPSFTARWAQSQLDPTVAHAINQEICHAFLRRHLLKG